MKYINDEIRYIAKAISIIILGMVLYFSIPFIPHVAHVYLSSFGLLVSALRLLITLKSFSDSLAIDKYEV